MQMRAFFSSFVTWAKILCRIGMRAFPVYFLRRYFSGSGGTGRLSSIKCRTVSIGWRNSILGPAQRMICFISSRRAG
jgi:hypothetical protein